MTQTQTDERSTPWRWIAALWCAFGLIEASQSALILRFAERKQHSWLPLFATELATWLPWALATPWVIALARRHPLVRGATSRAFALHLATFAAISVIAEAWSATLQVLVNPWGNKRWPTFWDTLSVTLLYQVLVFLIAYVLILTITYLVESRENIARQRTEAARLNEELANAQLAALRGQMDPHFMFNTLNSIAGLVRDRRNDAAVSMIAGLGEFLRRTSEDSHRSQVTLADEVEYLQRYVEIQKVRFGDRLHVSVDVPAELLGASVPNLLLQPLVENAIKHGIARRVAGGNIRVTCARQEAVLRLAVYNDGPGFEEDWRGNGGVGLANLRTRLGILYGDASALRVGTAGAGVEVVVTLPLKVA
jgi:two-component system, LytTR family, sensor kinase